MVCNGLHCCRTSCLTAALQGWLLCMACCVQRRKHAAACAAWTAPQSTACRPSLFVGVAAVPHLALRPAVCRLPAAGGLWGGRLCLKPLPEACCQASLASTHWGWCCAGYLLLAASGEVRLVASALLQTMAALRPHCLPPASRLPAQPVCRHSALPFALPHRLPFAS